MAGRKEENTDGKRTNLLESTSKRRKNQHWRKYTAGSAGFEQGKFTDTN
jgi:hypothetical protein